MKRVVGDTGLAPHFYKRPAVGARAFVYGFPHVPSPLSSCLPDPSSSPVSCSTISSPAAVTPASSPPPSPVRPASDATSSSPPPPSVSESQHAAQQPPLLPQQQPLPSSPCHLMPLICVPPTYSHPIVATVPPIAAFRFLSTLVDRLLGARICLDTRVAAYLPTINEILCTREMISLVPETLSDAALGRVALDLVVVCIDRDKAHDLAPLSHIFPPAALRAGRLTAERVQTRLNLYNVPVPWWMEGDVSLYANLIVSFIQAHDKREVPAHCPTPISHRILEFHTTGKF